MKGIAEMIKKTKGFTLVELMVVIAVIAILSAVSIPAIQTWLPNYRLRRAAMDLYSNFQKAKLTAVKRKCMCTINFNQPVGATTFDYIVFVDLNNDSVYQGDLTADGVDDDNDGTEPDADEVETIIAQVQLADYPDVSIDVTQGVNGFTFVDNKAVPPVPSISFRPNGLPCENGGGAVMGPLMVPPLREVFLRNTVNRTRQIQISTAGNVKILD
jgi:prepilin-type N-terminal cleavage/methylation domain-containing protein